MPDPSRLAPGAPAWPPCLQEERDRALAALWEIRMAAERATTDQPVWQLPNTIARLALGGMGRNRSEAQALAADRRRATAPR